MFRNLVLKEVRETRKEKQVASEIKLIGMWIHK